MSNAAGREETIRVISYDGKKVTWPSWKEKFLARSKKKGYKDILLKTTAVPTATDLGTGTDAEKAVKVAIAERNEGAFADLILSIDTTKATGRTVFNLIKNTKSADHPDGHAGNAWAALERKFNPTTAPSKAKLHAMFYKARLKKGADPINFITYLEDLRTRLVDTGVNMSDKNFILQAMNSLMLENLLALMI